MYFFSTIDNFLHDVEKLEINLMFSLTSAPCKKILLSILRVLAHPKTKDLKRMPPTTVGAKLKEKRSFGLRPTERYARKRTEKQQRMDDNRKKRLEKISIFFNLERSQEGQEKTPQRKILSRYICQKS